MVGDLFLFQRLLHPFHILFKMFECISCRNYSARTFSCDKASSSMYLGEVPNNELTHLGEEVAYISHMNWK